MSRTNRQRRVDASPQGAPMRTSIATVCLSGGLDDKLAAAAAAGFDGVEIFENDLIACASSPAGIRRRVEDLGLSMELYQPFRDFDTARPAWRPPVPAGRVRSCPLLIAADDVGTSVAERPDTRP
jgi:sugar phosphate isomerase/epimerase